MTTFTTFKGSKSGKIVESSTTREIRPDEVLVRITHSGLCGTDEHSRHTDMVLGHEGVGIVEVRIWLLGLFQVKLTSIPGTRMRCQKLGQR